MVAVGEDAGEALVNKIIFMWVKTTHAVEVMMAIHVVVEMILTVVVDTKTGMKMSVIVGIVGKMVLTNRIYVVNTRTLLTIIDTVILKTTHVVVAVVGGIIPATAITTNPT